MTDTDPRKTDAGGVFSRRGITVLAIAVVLWLIRYLPLFLPDARLWGINHLLFLPSGFTVAYAIAGILCLLALFPPISRRMESLFESAGRAFFPDLGYLPWAAVGVILLPIFWFFRMPTNLLGDGYTVINNIAGGLPVVFKWSEVGAVRAIYAVSRLVPVEGLARGEYAFALVSVVSGSLTIFFFFGIASELTKDRLMRLVFFCLLVFSGWSLLFFGYAENYPILWPFVTGYIYFAIRYLQGKARLIVPLIFLAVALLLHLQTVFFLASAIVLLLGRGRGRHLYNTHKAAAWIVIVGLAVIAIAAFVWEYHQSLPFRVHFLPVFTGRPATPNAAMFSPTHLLDMANELLLLVPLLPLLIILGWKGRRSLVDNPVGAFLLTFACGVLLLLLILDPRLGMGRDWDLFALSGLGVALVVMWCIASSAAVGRRLLPTLAVLAAVLVSPYFATNLSAKPSIEYMKWLLNLDADKNTSGMIMLRDYYRNTGDKQAADSLEAIIRPEREIVRLTDAAMKYAKAGRYQDAMAVVDSAFRMDPYSRESYNLRGAVYLEMGRDADAIRDFKTSLEMEPYDFRVLVNIARGYYRIGQRDSTMIYLHRAEKLNPNSPLVLQGLAMGFLAKQRYDSAYAYGRRLMAEDSTEANGWLAVGMYYYSSGIRDSARTYLERYATLVGPGPDRQRALRLLESLNSPPEKK
jgi:tetratricopeptide (TPR) repeat protein